VGGGEGRCADDRPDVHGLRAATLHAGLYSWPAKSPVPGFGGGTVAGRGLSPAMSNQHPRAPSKLRRDLCASTTDGTAYAVMVGMGEWAMQPFVFALGMGAVLTGLVTTVPPLVGAVLQLVTPWGVRRVGSHRRWIVLCAMLQGLALVPLAGVALMGRVSPAVLFLLVSLYWGAGYACGPAWATWIETVVPRRIRARYFGWRSRIVQLGTLGAFMVGAWILRPRGAPGTAGEGPLWRFAVLLGVAAVCRLVCAYFLSRQGRAGPIAVVQRRVPIPEVARRMVHGSDGRLLAFLLASQIATQVAQPYLGPYILGRLKLDYQSYFLLMGAAFLGRVAALPTLGMMAHQRGPRAVLWLGGAGLVAAPVLWMVSGSFASMLVAQFITGVFLAAFELSSLLMQIDHLRAEERTSMITTYSLANAACMSLGSALGGAVLTRVGGLTGAESWGAYAGVFGVSVVLRGVTLVLLGRVPRHAPSTAAEVLAAEAEAGMAEVPGPSGVTAPGASAPPGVASLLVEPAREEPVAPR
jgi:MFS family permease